MSNASRKISAKQRDDLLNTLKARFEKNASRHKGVDWAKVAAKLEEHLGADLALAGPDCDVVGR